MRAVLMLLFLAMICWGCSVGKGKAVICPSYNYYQAEPRQGQGRYSKSYKQSLHSRRAGPSSGKKSFITLENRFRKKKYKTRHTLRGY